MFEEKEQRPQPLDGPRIAIEDHLGHVVVIVQGVDGKGCLWCIVDANVVLWCAKRRPDRCQLGKLWVAWVKDGGCASENVPREKVLVPGAQGKNVSVGVPHDRVKDHDRSLVNPKRCLGRVVGNV